MINPAKLDGDRRDSICISCHLEGDTSVEHRGRSVANFKPGERIQDYSSYFVYAGANMADRGVSEIEQTEPEPVQAQQWRTHVVHELP